MIEGIISTFQIFYIENVKPLATAIDTIWILGAAIVLIGGYFYRRSINKRVHEERFYDGQITYSLNRLEKQPNGRPILRFRTLLEAEVGSVLPSDPLLTAKIREANLACNYGNVFVNIADVNAQKFYLNSIANHVLSAVFGQWMAQAQLTADNGGFRKERVIIGSTFEPYDRVRSRKTRVMLFERGELEEADFDNSDGHIALEFDYHSDRLATLSEFQEHWSNPESHEIIVMEREVWIPEHQNLEGCLQKYLGKN